MRLFTKKIKATPPMLLSDGDKLLSISIGNSQIKGQRKEQQDSFGWSKINKEKGSILAVLSDGMGGLSEGMMASKMVVQHFITAFHNYNDDHDIPLFLETTTEGANDIILKENQKKKLESGATLVAAIIIKNELYWSSVGDSRLYLFRGEGLYQMNEDHSLENFKLHMELNGQAVTEELNGSLSSYLGKEYLADIDFNRHGFRLQNNDYLILCTDGIYNTISGDEWKGLTILQTQAASEKVCKIVNAKKHLYQDNGTIMIINFMEE